MTYRGVDHDRLAKLIANGLTDEELRAFFKSKRSALILARDKQNTPSDTEDAIRRVLRFSDKAHTIFGEWIRKQPHTYPDLLETQLVPRFTSIDREGVRFSESEFSQLCRCGLVELYSEIPQHQWLDFLKGGHKPHAESDDASGDVNQTTLPVYEPVSEKALESFLRVTSGELKPHEIEDSTLRFLAEILVIGIGRSAAEPSQWPEPFSGYGGLRARILEAIKANAAKTSGPNIATGVVAEGPAEREYDRQSDYSSYIIIATRPKFRINKPYFLDVEGFIDNGEIFTLSDQELRSALPEEGRLILFQESGIEPAIGEPLAYHVESRQTEYSIKVAARKLERCIAPIVYVPH